jgi:hypothetical protein
MTTAVTITDLLEVLKACADDLEALVEDHYKATKGYPSERRRYERDIAPVVKARAIIARAEKEHDIRGLA